MRTLGCAHYPDTREEVRTIPMHARMCALFDLSRCTLGCAHYPDARENVRTIPIHARMCALSRCTRGCVHYPDAREDVCTIPMHARMCAVFDLSRCTRGCAHYSMHARMCALPGRPRGHLKSDWFYLVVNLSVRKTKAMHFKKPSQPGETLMSNNRFAMHIDDLRNFVLLKTYRKRATEDHILRAQIVKIRVPYGCGPTRIQLTGQIVITDNRQR